ncbi:AMP-binding protein [Amycolatopsis rubida]|nr:AMP-binding protein [Amycolatopsis rubida]
MDAPRTDRLALLRWLWEPRPDTGIRFAGDEQEWSRWDYPRLAAGAHARAAELLERGAARGDVVLVVEPTGPGFLTGYFGAMLAGAVPAPASPPLFGQDLAQWRTLLASLTGTARPRFVCTAPGFAETVRQAVGPEPVLLEEAPGGGPVPPVPAADLAMLQFTSGSSGSPRGVRVPFPALTANVRAIREWLAMGPDDPTASWLPMHHDMGLIGCLLTPVTHQTDLWLCSPQQFLRRPSRYLRCFGESGARLTAMPTFGLEHILRRVRPAELSGCDFSEWRAVIVGAERVAEPTLRAFADLLAPYGFAPESLLPAYGLAEATLAVTGSRLDERWTTRSIAPAGPGQAAGGEAATLVGCGRPLAGVSVTVLDSGGDPLPEDRVGEIAVAGPSVADGYHAGAVAQTTRFGRGAVRTGDAGFLSGGQLYVLGRMGDSMKVRGKPVFAEDLEAALEAHGLPRRQQAVLLGVVDGAQVAVVVAEHADPALLDLARTDLARLAEGAELIMLSAATGTIPRTTSGKPRRRELWRRFADGNLPREGAGRLQGG